MDEEPTIGDVIVTRYFDGVPYQFRELLVERTQWYSLVKPRISDIDAWSVTDFKDFGFVVAIGPMHGLAIDVPGQRPLAADNRF